MKASKKTVRLESTAARKARASPEADAVQPVYVFLRGERALTTHHALFLVMRCTRDLEVGQTVDGQFVANETDIDVCEERNAAFLEILKAHAYLNVVCSDDGVRISRRPSFGIVDKETLLQEILRRRTGSVMTITKADLENTYKGVQQDLDALVCSGHVNELKGDPSVYFARAPGVQASAAVRDLWNAVRVPTGDLLQDALASRKILTKEEIVERRQRGKRERANTHEKQFAQKQHKKVVLRGRITNSHLHLPEHAKASK